MELDGAYLSTYLYDGQTQEQLAFFMKKSGEKDAGFVAHGPGVSYEGQPVADGALDYIGNLMDDKDYRPKK